MSAPRNAALCLGILVSTTCAHAAGSALHVTERIPGPDGGWDYASYDAVRDRVLVARAEAVTAFDLKTRRVNPAFATASRGHAAFPVNGGAEVVITNGTANTAAFVDAETGAPIATVATGDGPDDAVIDPRSGLLLVMNHRGGDVTLIDPKAHRVEATIAVGGKLEAAAVDGAGRVFVNVEDRNQIAVIDIAARRVTARYALTGCEGPTGIAYAATAQLLIVACDGVAEVVAADTGKVVRQIKIGEGADGVAYDAGRKLAFIPSGRDGTLAVIAIARGDARKVESVQTQVGARTLALDPVSGRIFLPAANYAAATTPGTRPTTVPGSFQLLIVGR